MVAKQRKKEEEFNNNNRTGNKQLEKIKGGKER